MSNTFYKRACPARGFTLVEVLVYLALFSIVISGALVAGIGLFEASGKNVTHSQLDQEGSFLLAKISWALSGVTEVHTPADNNLGTSLSVEKVLGLDSNGNPQLQEVVVEIDPFTNKDMRIIKGSHAPQKLNNSNVEVTSLLFYHQVSTGIGINPTTVGVRFTLTTHTPEGKVLSREFFSTSTLRQ